MQVAENARFNARLITRSGGFNWPSNVGKASFATLLEAQIGAEAALEVQARVNPEEVVKLLVLDLEDERAYWAVAQPAKKRPELAWESR